MELLRKGYTLATSNRYTKYAIPPLLLGDAALTYLIIKKIPYTEIDWQAYMTQISQILAGETDYSLIKGSTGPLVYPGVHVHIFRFLYNITNGGTDIPLAQYIFGGVYILTLLLVLLAYRKAGAPPWILPLLVLSKRLHSIYVLRLFNDCWSVLLLWASVLAWEYKMWTAGAILWSLSVGVKMSGMLIAPAVACILLYGTGGKRALKSGFIWLQIQFLMALPFIREYPRSYLSGAFELTRQFLYKWTVNFRFVPEPTFLSRPFALALLLLHLTLLYTFLFRWCRPSRLPPSSIPLLLTSTTTTPLQEAQISARVTPAYILTSILTANAIGMLCARSLHYQFYSWLAWGTPYLLWRSGLGPVWVLVIWAAQEWAWNVYPSTELSSAVVVAALVLAVFGAWVGTAGGDGVPNEEVEEDETRVRVEVKKGQ